MKLLFKILILVAVFCGGLYLGVNKVLAPTVPSRQVINQEQISLMIDYGNGQVQTFGSLALNAETGTVFKLLEKIAEVNNLEFKYKDYGDLGVFVESINGFINNGPADRYWQYWVNNEYAKVGASQQVLKSGDVVEWKYTKGQIKN